VALAAARAAATLEDILAAANAGPGKGEKGLIVLLDGVEDPHNLGRSSGRRWQRGSRSGGAGAARGGVDGYRGAGFGGCAVAFAGGEGDEFGADDGGVEGSGLLVDRVG